MTGGYYQKARISMFHHQIIERGQRSGIYQIKNAPPFEEWWNLSKDIIADWNDVKIYRDKWEKNNSKE